MEILSERTQNSTKDQKNTAKSDKIIEKMTIIRILIKRFGGD